MQRQHCRARIAAGVALRKDDAGIGSEPGGLRSVDLHRGQRPSLFVRPHPRIGHGQAEPLRVLRNRIDVCRRTVLQQRRFALVPGELVRRVRNREPRIGQRRATRLEQHVIVDADERATGKLQQCVIERAAVGRLAGSPRCEQPPNLPRRVWKLGEQCVLHCVGGGAIVMRDLERACVCDRCAVGLLVSGIVRVVDHEPASLLPSARFESLRACEEPRQQLWPVGGSHDNAAERGGLGRGWRSESRHELRYGK